MSEDPKFIVKIKKHGSSLGITIPKYVRELYNLKIGDFLQISLKKIKRENYIGEI